MNNTWSFRFLMWFVLWLMTQPHFRFPFLVPFHCADILFAGAFGLHVLYSMSNNKNIIYMGPVTKMALTLLGLAMVSHFFNPAQKSIAWNGEIDIILKVVVVIILLEAQVDSVYKAAAVIGTLCLGSMWWIKGGVRLSQAGATMTGDRIMGVNVSMISNPNELAYVMCIMIPALFFFYAISRKKLYQWGFIALIGAAAFVVLRTGSRTGLVALTLSLVFMGPRMLKKHKEFVTIALVGGFFLIGAIGASNIERFKAMRVTAIAFFTKSSVPLAELNQDELSAASRMTKIIDTAKLVAFHYPVLGVGTNPKVTAATDLGLGFAKGKVHSEPFMAARQMGIGGFILYYLFLYKPFMAGRRMHRYLQDSWPEMATMGWALQGMLVAVAVGGLFSPSAWNFPHMLTASVCLITSEMLAKEGLLPASDKPEDVETFQFSYAAT